jgi:hypothetical protein
MFVTKCTLYVHIKIWRIKPTEKIHLKHVVEKMYCNVKTSPLRNAKFMIYFQTLSILYLLDSDIFKAVIAMYIKLLHIH